MMRITIISGLIIVAFAAPVIDEKQAKIINYINEGDGEGNYKFSFETSNGISREESGTVVNAGQPDQYIYVQGTVSFPDPDGQIQTIRYNADKNGYEILPPPEQPIVQVDPHVVATLLG